jgi:hypothetical protein
MCNQEKLKERITRRTVRVIGLMGKKTGTDNSENQTAHKTYVFDKHVHDCSRAFLYVTQSINGIITRIENQNGNPTATSLV